MGLLTGQAPNANSMGARRARSIFPLWIAASLVGCSTYHSGDPQIASQDRGAAWSPDGRQIAYSHFNANPLIDHQASGLYLLPVGGGSSRLLVAGDASNPTWDGSGSYLIFQDSVLRFITVDGRETLTIEPFRCFYPTWSPDGSRIAFDSPHQSPTGSSTIWISRWDGSELRNISQQGVGEWRDPDWSPDGSKILHERYIGIGTTELFVMDTLGSQPVRLTNNTWDDRDPKWSPDGLSIAWTSFQDRKHPAIWIMTAAGLNPMRLTAGQEPSWSPDGQHLVLSAEAADRTIRLFIVGRDGQGRAQLTH